MKIVVTGAQGFIGKNLCVMLEENGYTDLVRVDRETGHKAFAEALVKADFIFHLAGVNRPKDEGEFIAGNTEVTRFIVDELKTHGRNPPIMLSSSTQVERGNAYGQSKSQAEELVANYGEITGAPTYIYRFPNVFGKWCRPDYNSFIATFCHNIANSQEITIHDPDSSVTLVYIDDVCWELLSLLKGGKSEGLCRVEPEYEKTVGEVALLLRAFKNSRENLVTEAVGLGFVRALYSTYLSYLKPEQFSYNIPGYADERGVFCEVLKTKDAGQFSFFTAHPGITRGGHYHHSKNEKFLVIKGHALFKFEHIITGERYELKTSGNSLQIVETIPGWSHDVTNIGEGELVVMLWANEIFDRANPDTFAFTL